MKNTFFNKNIFYRIKFHQKMAKKIEIDDLLNFGIFQPFFALFFLKTAKCRYQKHIYDTLLTYICFFFKKRKNGKN